MMREKRDLKPNKKENKKLRRRRSRGKRRKS
jgi:hypothetical protein